MTILRRFHVQYPGTTVWADITGRVIGDVRFTEGRNLTLLGGPLPPAVPATLQCTLDNATGYFTKGAGSAFGPGARFRMQWRGATGDAWVTRYVGRLSERRIRFQGSSRILTRWYGALIALTGSDLPTRNYGNFAAEVIMAAIADAAGIPAGNQDFDSSGSTNYPVTLAAGYAGVVQFADIVEGFIHDTPDGKVRLELPATRVAKTVAATYSDLPTGSEIGIPPPEVLTNPFGILNHVDGELRIFAPSAGSNVEVDFPTVFNSNGPFPPLWPAWRDFMGTMPIGFEPSPSVAVTAWEFEVRVQYIGRPYVEHPLLTSANEGLTTDAFSSTVVDGERATFFECRNFSIVVTGSNVTVRMEYRANHTLEGLFRGTSIVDFWNMQVTVDDSGNVVQDEQVYVRALEDAGSQTIHGLRRRASPLIVSQYVDDLDTYTPDFTYMIARLEMELGKYSNPQQVYIVETTAATDAERTSLLARRLSDKVHLRLAGQSQLDVDADFFVEAMETVLTPEGNATQLLHVVEDPGFVPLSQLSAPTGLALTESGGNITANWNTVTDATGYVLEWREQGSGDAWQEVDVTTPPHTFTP